MKRVSILTMSFIVLFTFSLAQAQQLKTIKLNTPNDLGGRPRAGFDKDTIRNLMKLKETQKPILGIPVGHK